MRGQILVSSLFLVLALISGTNAQDKTDNANDQTKTSEDSWRQNVDLRLKRMESELQLIKQHLNLNVSQDHTFDDAGNGNGGLDRLDLLQEEIDKLKELQTQNEDSKSDSRNGTQGKLVVENRRGNHERLTIDGQIYTFAPGRTEIWVPYRPVTAHLTFYGKPKRWNNWRWIGLTRVLRLVIN